MGLGWAYILWPVHLCVGGGLGNPRTKVSGFKKQISGLIFKSADAKTNQRIQNIDKTFELGAFPNQRIQISSVFK